MTLKLETICQIEGLLHESQFRNRLLKDLLGQGLQEFIGQILTELGMSAKDGPKVLGRVHSSAVLEGQVWVSENAEVGPHAYVIGPCFIGPGSEVRHAAFVRGDVYIGKKCVVGHTTEVKGSLFLDGAKAGHFAYVGDSILGPDVNLGAGTKLANLKLKGDEVRWRDPVTSKAVSSGLRKLGAILGNGAQTGCNSVLSPGTILMPHTSVLPCVHFHGTLNK